MTEFRVSFDGRMSRTYETFEEARSAKRIEFFWSGRVGEIQERIGDEWVPTDDQRVLLAGKEQR